MKIITAILSIVLLVLSSIPCSDRFGKVADIGNSENVSVHNQEDQNTDDCSPLCNCSCCANFVINQQSQSVLKLCEQYIGIVFPILIDERIKEMQYGIWQPPQLLA